MEFSARDILDHIQTISEAITDPETDAGKKAMSAAEHMARVIGILQRKNIRTEKNLASKYDRVEDLKKRIGIDELTNLPKPKSNFYPSVVKYLLSDRRRNPRHLFVLWFLDIKRFGEINKKILGHLEANKVLVRIAKLIQPREADHFLCRFGGEEFIVLLPNVIHEELPEISQRLSESIAEFDWKSEVTPLPSFRGDFSIQVYVGAAYCTNKDLHAAVEAIKSNVKARSQKKNIREEILFPLMKLADQEMGRVKESQGTMKFSSKEYKFFPMHP